MTSEHQKAWPGGKVATPPTVRNGPGQLADLAGRPQLMVTQTERRGSFLGFAVRNQKYEPAGVQGVLPAIDLTLPNCR